MGQGEDEPLRWPRCVWRGGNKTEQVEWKGMQILKRQSASHGDAWQAVVGKVLRVLTSRLMESGIQ